MITEGNISTENTEFLDAAVARGVFPSREAAIDQAVRLLRRRQAVFDEFERRARELPAPLPALLDARPGGIYVIRGHRITLHLIAEFYFGGMHAPAAMQEQFPSLSLADVQQVLSYIQQHESEVRTYHEANLRCCEEWKSESKPGPSLEEMRARMAKIRAARA